MRRLPLIRSIVATLFGFGVAAVIGATIAAPPAAAADPCCQVALNGLPGQFHAGGAPQTFRVVVQNKSQEALNGITVTLAFKANNLERNLLHLQYQRNGGWRSVGTRNQDGVIVGTSQPNSDFFRNNNINPGQQVSFTYRLWFDSKTSTAPLSVWLTVAPSRHQNQSAQAGPYQSALVGIGAATTPKPTPKPTDTPSATPSETITDDPTATQSQDPGAVSGGQIGGSGDDSSDMTWLAYTIGALLLLGGVGVIGTLLWRRGPQPVETDWQDPAYVRPAGGYPQQAAPPQPTAVFQPGPQDGGYATHTMPMPPATSGGRHSAPTSHYPAPQDPYVDETMIDPR